MCRCAWQCAIHRAFWLRHQRVIQDLQPPAQHLPLPEAASQELAAGADRCVCGRLGNKGLGGEEVILFYGRCVGEVGQGGERLTCFFGLRRQSRSLAGERQGVLRVCSRERRPALAQVAFPQSLSRQSLLAGQRKG